MARAAELQPNQPSPVIDKLAMQADLLSSGIVLGVTRSWHEVEAHRLETGMQFLAAATAAVVLCEASHNSGAVGQVAKVVLGADLVKDLGCRSVSTILAAKDVWRDPNQFEKSQNTIASSLGEGVFNYALYGTAGYLGLRTAHSHLSASVSSESIAAKFNSMSPDKTPVLKFTSSGREFASLLHGSEDERIAQLYERARHSTVQIRGDRGTASGFIVDDQGLVVTNDHVLRRNKIISIVTSTGEQYATRLIARDARTDLALLKTIETPADKPFIPVELGSSYNLEKDAPVLAIGYPKGTQRQVLSIGRYLRPRTVTLEDAQSPFYRTLESGEKSHILRTSEIVHSAPGIKGTSGGPVFELNSGNVIGINWGGSNKLSRATSTEHLAALIEASKSLDSPTGWLEVRTHAVGKRDARVPVRIVSTEPGVEVAPTTSIIEQWKKTFLSMPQTFQRKNCYLGFGTARKAFMSLGLHTLADDIKHASGHCFDPD